MKDIEGQPNVRRGPAGETGGEERPRYEPPRIVKKRSVSRVTLSFSSSGISAAGLPGSPN